nr:MULTISPECIES: DUF3180 domain-containing protein [unclassified Cryobacterium]
MIVLGAIVGAFVETALATTGRPILIPPITLAVALALIGVLIVVLALPIRRTVRKKTATPIDPFYATRILMLAKASALSGALIAGFAGGAIAYLLTRSVIGVGSVAAVSATIVGAGLLLAGGLVAEELCRVPPGSDDDDDEDTGAPPVTVSH